MNYSSITFNLSNTPIRRETLHGRQYIVAPMAMLTEGVHNGSGGPLLYREAECRKAVPAWNMKPIVVYHPSMNGQGVSACDPDILERQQVGMVMNCTWNGKLRADAWIEEDRANAIDPRITDALENNKMMEVSTGLFTDNTPATGTWNGEDYIAEAMNHQPDHLALLPDQIGACSIADGAGLLQMNEAAQARGVDITHLLAQQMDVLRRMVGNAMSYNDRQMALRQALQARLGGIKDVWIVDMFDKYFIYDTGDGKKLFKVDYTTGKDTVEITGDPVEVVRTTDYKPVTNAVDIKRPTGNEAQKTTKKKGTSMNKHVVVSALIANALAIFNEDDRDRLMGLEDEALIKLDESFNNPPVATPEPTAPVQMTTDEYIASAPDGIRDVLANALATQNEQKKDLVKIITANANNKFSAEFLATKGLQELQGMAALCATAAPVANGHQPGVVPMFAGQATMNAAPVVNVDALGEPLVMPVMSFG